MISQFVSPDMYGELRAEDVAHVDFYCEFLSVMDWYSDRCRLELSKQLLKADEPFANPVAKTEVNKAKLKQIRNQVQQSVTCVDAARQVFRGMKSHMSGIPEHADVPPTLPAAADDQSRHEVPENLPAPAPSMQWIQARDQSWHEVPTYEIVDNQVVHSVFSQFKDKHSSKFAQPGRPNVQWIQDRDKPTPPTPPSEGKKVLPSESPYNPDAGPPTGPAPMCEACYCFHHGPCRARKCEECHCFHNGPCKVPCEKCHCFHHVSIKCAQAPKADSAVGQIPPRVSELLKTPVATLAATGTKVEEVLLALPKDLQDEAGEIIRQKLDKELTKAVETVTAVHGYTVAGTKRQQKKNVYQEWLEKMKNDPSPAGVRFQSYDAAQRKVMWQKEVERVEAEKATAYVNAEGARKKRLANKIDLNSCTADALIDMQMICQTLAFPALRNRIIFERDQLPDKQFRGWADLSHIEGLGPATLQTLKTYCVIKMAHRVLSAGISVETSTVSSALFDQMRTLMMGKEPLQEVVKDDDASKFPMFPEVVDVPLLEKQGPTDNTTIAYKVKNTVFLMREARKPGFMWFDTGCLRCVCGPDDHLLMTKALEARGLKPEYKDKQEKFIFGDGATEWSTHNVIYPCFIAGKCVGSIDIAFVKVPCPPLFSLSMAAKWDCITNHKEKIVTLGKYDHKIPFKNGVTPYVDVFDFPENLDKSTVPNIFRIE
jgi:DNA uptake protein ComE-like DNA-binding protein